MLFERNKMNRYALQFLLRLGFMTICFEIFSKDDFPQITAISGNNAYTSSDFSTSDKATISNQSGFFTSFFSSMFFHHQNQIYSEQQLNDLAITAYLQKVMTPSEYKEFRHQKHLYTYGISADYAKNILLEKKIEDIERWIICNKQLSANQACNLWDACCHVKGAREKIKNKGLGRIEQAYDRRKKEELQKQEKEKILQQEQQQQLEKEQHVQQVALKKQQEKEEKSRYRFLSQKKIVSQRLIARGIDPEQCVYLPQDFEMLQNEYEYTAQYCKEMQQYNDVPIWTERLYAAQKTDDQDFVQSLQELSLSPQAQGYLIAYKHTTKSLSNVLWHSVAATTS